MPRKKKTYPELDAVAHLVGTMPDADVAKMANASASIVGQYRRERNIAAYQGYKFGFGGDEAATPASDAAPAAKAPSADAPAEASEATPTARRPRASKIEPFRELVGQRPDRGRGMAGVTPEAVRMYRRRHGIYGAPRKAAASASSSTRGSPGSVGRSSTPSATSSGPSPTRRSPPWRASRPRTCASAAWALRGLAQQAGRPGRRSGRGGGPGRRACRRCDARHRGRPSSGRPGLQRRGRGQRRDLLHHRDGHRLGGGGGPQGPARGGPHRLHPAPGSGDRLTFGSGLGGRAGGCVGLCLTRAPRGPGRIRGSG